jgi:hypothetical protein
MILKCGGEAGKPQAVAGAETQPEPAEVDSSESVLISGNVRFPFLLLRTLKKCNSSYFSLDLAASRAKRSDLNLS